MELREKRRRVSTSLPLTLTFFFRRKKISPFFSPSLYNSLPPPPARLVQDFKQLRRNPVLLPRLLSTAEISGKNAQIDSPKTRAHVIDQSCDRKSRGGGGGGSSRANIAGAKQAIQGNTDGLRGGAVNSFGKRFQDRFPHFFHKRDRRFFPFPSHGRF